ncbi:UNVERIFIED_CONTAM: hypothetical protein FKN15_031000 [Acipenser sinensis]
MKNRIFIFENTTLANEWNLCFSEYHVPFCSQIAFVDRAERSEPKKIFHIPLLEVLVPVDAEKLSVNSNVRNCTLAIHIAQQDWEDAVWREMLTDRLAMTTEQVQQLVDQGERFGRGVIAGLVDIGETWQCPDELSAEEMRDLETKALLNGLEEKYLTLVSNPRWLSEPLYSRGRKDVWTIEIPERLIPSPCSV